MNYLEMSDEELMNVQPSLENEQQTEEKEEQPQAEPEENTNGSLEHEEIPENNGDTQEETTPDQESGADSHPGASQESNSTEPDSVDAQQTASIDAAKATRFYKQVMAPLKANGKTIQLRSPEEAIQLMQMGANYTQKMQAIAPHRKILMTLQKYDLLNEDKIKYLIDLDQKNPDAIKKLVKDSEINLYDLDMSEEPSYTSGVNMVSDQEMAFRSTVDELKNDPLGSATLNLVKDWDEPSIGEIYKNPQILRDINEQRANGVFDMIVSEMSRANTLGQIPPNTPFLQAYVMIGNRLMQQRQQANTPVATRVAQPKSAFSNNEAAKAATHTRNTTKKVNNSNINYFALSDEEILKLSSKFQY